MFNHNFHSYSRQVYDRLYTKPFFVVTTAPEDYPSLVKAGVPIPVFGGASDQTIFGDPSTNWLQRAVHDTIHRNLEALTTADGEYRVAVEQCRQIAQYSAEMARVTWADLYGQTAYFGHHGSFPVNQVAFIEHYLCAGSVVEVF